MMGNLMNRNEIKWKTLPIIQICEFLIKVISSDNFHFHVLILKPPLRSFLCFLVLGSLFLQLSCPLYT